MKTRSLLAFLVACVVLLTACGGATATPSGAPATGAAAADTCGVPVKTKCPTEAQNLTGAGATFPGAIYAKWVDEYNKLTGVQINYQAVGSGGGIKAFTDKTADFGASDVPLTDDQVRAIAGGLFMVPMVMGAVVPTYNIPNVTAKLKFTPDALAGIFLGTITSWNDPKLVADNADAKLPDKPIVAVVRSDGSGTSYAFSEYLSKVSPDFKTKVGTGTSVNWPKAVGAKGNDGVAGAVKSTPNSIGYVELIYAIQQKLGTGLLRNAAGSFVEPSLDAVSKAADGIDYPADLRVSITNSPAAGAWPISTFTFFVTYASITDKAKALAMARFFWWGTHDGQAFAKDLGYAPLPKTAQQKAEEKIRSISSGGEAVLPK